MCSVLRTDQRGFALQTVIVMTALIAVAMAVSAVMITRGGDVVVDLERQNITVQPSQIKNKVQCEQIYLWTWTGNADTGTCSDP